MLGKKNGVNGNQKKNRDHPDHIIGKIGQKTKKSPKDLKKPCVPQTQMQDSQLTLQWETNKDDIINQSVHCHVIFIDAIKLKPSK